MLRLLKYSQEELRLYIKNNKCRVYVYGAGMIGKIVIPDFFERYGIEDNLQLYLDGDKRKQGSFIQVKDRAVKICSIDDVKQWDKNSLIIITNSNYSTVLSMLDSMQELDGAEAVIFPVMQAVEINEKKNTGKIQIKDYCSDEIPKVIHYCWFSGNPIPERFNRCIESWKNMCPDYEIVKWDESNYNIDKNMYTRQAYDEGKWAFVADYARLDILYNHGGFYMDTDVELLKPLDSLRKQGAFFGVEKWGNVNTGGCCGTLKKHDMIKKMLDYRENVKFKYDDGTLNLETNGVYETIPFLQAGMRSDNSVQRVNGATIFSSEFFHPYDYMSGETVITDNTFSIHHFNGGWLDEKSRAVREKTVKSYNELLSGRMDG